MVSKSTFVKEKENVLTSQASQDFEGIPYDFDAKASKKLNNNKEKKPTNGQQQTVPNNILGEDYETMLKNEEANSTLQNQLYVLEHQVEAEKQEKEQLTLKIIEIEKTHHKETQWLRDGYEELKERVDQYRSNEDHFKSLEQKYKYNMEDKDDTIKQLKENVEGLERKIEQIQNKDQTQAGELTNTKEQLSTLRINIEKNSMDHARIINNLKEKHSRQMDMMKAKQEQQLKESTQKMEDARLSFIENLRKEHSKEMKRLSKANASLKKEMNEWMKHSASQTQELTNEFTASQKQAASLVQELSSQNQQLLKAKDQALEQLENQNQKLKDELQRIGDKLTTKATNWQAKEKALLSQIENTTADVESMHQQQLSALEQQLKQEQEINQKEHEKSTAYQSQIKMLEQKMTMLEKQEAKIQNVIHQSTKKLGNVLQTQQQQAATKEEQLDRHMNMIEQLVQKFSQKSAAVQVQYKAQLDQSAKALKAKEEQSKRLSSANENLSKQVQELTQQNEQVTLKNSEYMSKIETLQREHAASTERVETQSNTEMDHLKHRIEQMQKQLNERESQNNMILQSKNILGDTVKTLEQLVAEKNTQIDTLHKEKKDLTHELAIQENQDTSIQNQLLKEELALVKKNLLESEGERKKLVSHQSSITTNEALQSKFNQELDTMKSKVNTLEQQVEKEKKVREEMEAAVRDAQLEFNDLRAKIDRKREQCNSLHHEREELKQKLGEQRHQSNVLESRYETAFETITKLKQSCNKHESAMDSLKSQIEQYRDYEYKYSSLKEDHLSLQKERNAHVHENSVLTEQIQQLNQLNEQLQRFNTQLQSSSNSPKRVVAKEDVLLRKRKRPENEENDAFSHLEADPQKKKLSVIVQFSGFNPSKKEHRFAELKSRIIDLGGEVITVEDSTQSIHHDVTHLIAVPGVRTLKTLSAVLKGVWICSPEWVDACWSAKKFLPLSSFPSLPLPSSISSDWPVKLDHHQFGWRALSSILQDSSVFFTPSFSESTSKVKHARTLITEAGGGSLVSSIEDASICLCRLIEMKSLKQKYAHLPLKILSFDKFIDYLFPKALSLVDKSSL